jgi:hypothetical protein
MAAAALLTPVAFLAGSCGDAEAQNTSEDAFPREYHSLLPLTEGQVAAGAVSGEVLEQPIAFSHNIHAGQLGMDCQFCHSVARKSIHSGVPPTQTCVNCHQHIKRRVGATEDSPEIAKIFEFYDAGEPIPWQKVHDLPDYVHFSHKRHVRAGVDCTECHGQVATMDVAVRESTLQMGWCLDCHASHPSIEQNYGEQADLRRAELKDCWTCHK